MNKIWKYVIGIGFGTAIVLTTANRLSELNKEGEAAANLHYHNVPLRTGVVSKEAYDHISITNTSHYPFKLLMDGIYAHNNLDYGKLKPGSLVNMPCDGGEKCPTVKDKQIMEDLEKMRGKGEEAIEKLGKK